MDFPVSLCKGALLLNLCVKCQMKDEQIGAECVWSAPCGVCCASRIRPHVTLQKKKKRNINSAPLCTLMTTRPFKRESTSISSPLCCDASRHLKSRLHSGVERSYLCLWKKAESRVDLFFPLRRLSSPCNHTVCPPGRRVNICPVAAATRLHNVVFGQDGFLRFHSTDTASCNLWVIQAPEREMQKNN